MIKILPDVMKQVILTSHEAGMLRIDLEAAFIAIDTETKGQCYSMENIRIKHPRLVELYNCLK